MGGWLGGVEDGAGGRGGLLTSTASRLVRPSRTGRAQVGSGTVRLQNHRAPPAARSDCSPATGGERGGGGGVHQFFFSGFILD